MSELHTGRPRHGTTWRDLPPSPPIGEAPPPMPPPPAAEPAEVPAPATAARWSLIGVLVAAVVAVTALAVWSPWNGDSEARQSALNGENRQADGGSIFGERSPAPGLGAPPPASDDQVVPPNLFDNFGIPDDFARRFDEEFRRFFEQNPEFGLITPDGVDDLLEEFGLPPDVLERLRNGESLDELLDGLPEALRDRLEGRFGFGAAAFGLTYVPDGYQVTSASNERFADGRDGSETRVTLRGPEGEIQVTIVSGAGAGDIEVPSEAEPVDIPNATAGVTVAGSQHTLTWVGDGLAGRITAPAAVPVEELARIAAGARSR